MKRLLLCALFAVSVPVLQGCLETPPPRTPEAIASDVQTWISAHRPDSDYELVGISGRDVDTEGDNLISKDVTFKVKATGKTEDVKLSCGAWDWNQGCTLKDPKAPVTYVSE